MYNSVKIQQPSQNQMTKLKKGQKVRLKLGNDMILNVSDEQSKKLHKASKKGAGVMVQLDPYQREYEGEGFISFMKKHKVGRKLKNFAQNQILPIAKQAIIKKLGGTARGRGNGGALMAAGY